MLSVASWFRARARDVTALLLGLMFFAFIAQILFRYVLGLPLGWTLEACLTTWLWAVFWGASFDLDEVDHVKFDILYLAFDEPVRRVFAFVASAAFVVAFVASLPATYDYVTFYKIKRSNVLGIRLDYVFSIYLIFATCMIARYGLRCWRIVTGGPFEPAPSAGDRSEVV